MESAQALMSAQRTPTSAPRISGGRVPLFCDTGLAGRIERVEAQLVTQGSEAARRRTGAAGFAIPVAGGVASFAGEGSPFNKVAGLGFGGMPEPAALDEIEQAFAACGSPVQIELAHLADPAIGELLTGRGYRLESFENVLGRALTGEPQPVLPPGVEVRPSGEAESEAWLDVVAEGSIHPDTQGVPWHEEFPRQMIIDVERDMAAAGTTVRYAGLHDGILAGGATMRIAEGDGRLLSIAVRGDRGDLRGGLYGWTWGGCGYIDLLWVRDDQRSCGLGTKLLAAAEAEIARRGCDRVALSTHTFQAPGFYARLGYTECGRTPGYPHGHDGIHLMKQLH